MRLERSAPSLSSADLSAALGIVRDRLLAADPGFTRLQMAAHVTLAVAFSVLALSILAAFFDQAVTTAILGAVIAMQATLAIDDPLPRTTTLLAPIPGTLGIVLGALVASRGLLADAVFLVVLFCAVAARRFGPRGAAFGTIAMMAYFFALFLGATLGQLPALVAAVWIAVGITYLVRFVLLPDRPRFIAQRTVAAFDARLRIVADASRELVEARDPSAARRHLESALARLKETAASIESRLAVGADDELRIVFDAELAAEDLAAEARSLRDAAARVPRPLRLALTALGRGRVARAARVAGRVADDAGPIHPAARGLAAAIVDLGETMVRVDATADVLALSDRPWSGSARAQQPVMRQALQVTVASAVAIAVGEALSPQRWYWAVLASYFVFVGTASSGETFARAWSRIGGTALGVGAGILVGHAAQGHPWFALAAIFACLFLAVYFLRISHLLMIFFITADLALLYTLLGRFSDGLLGIRLAETAIGAICGGIAATFLFPTRTRDVVRESARAALAAARATVDVCIERLLEPGGAAAPLEAARELEERVLDFTARAKPAITVPVLVGRGHELRRWIVSLSACSYYGRLLARVADRATLAPNAEIATELRALDAIFDRNLSAAEERVAGRYDAAATNTLPLFDALRARTAGEPAAEELAAFIHLLERLDRTIARLARDEQTVTEIA